MKSKLQSAMEYLMTYGWAILVIAVVLGVLYSLGIFSPSNFAPKAQPGSCQVFRPNGPGTSYDANLEGTCSGELPQYVAVFNGENSYVNASTSNILSMGNSLTISVWINPSFINPLKSYGLHNMVVYRGDGCACTINYAMQIDNATGLSFVKRTSAEGLQYYTFTVPSLLDVWSHVSVVVSGANVILYDNGVEDGIMQLNSQGIVANSGQGFAIGSIFTFNSVTNFNGSITNVQIYDEALSTNDVNALYQEGIGGAPINLQYLAGWWPLNGNANDYSGNNNNGASTKVEYTGTWQSGYTPP